MLTIPRPLVLVAIGTLVLALCAGMALMAVAASGGASSLDDKVPFAVKSRR